MTDGWPIAKTSLADTSAARGCLRYMQACRNDPGREIQLYEWNLQPGSAFQECMMTLEVLVRNAIDEQLRPWTVAKNQNQNLH